VKISTRSVGAFGKIVVDGRGRTLYMFVPDKHKKVTCHAVCAKIWPPVFVKKGAKLVAAGGVKQSLLGSDPDSTGGRVATYNHWPLYLYVGDRQAGIASGQALNVNGGLWYVMSPSGAIIKAKGGAGGGGGGGGTTTTGGGGGGGTNCSDDDGDGDGTAGGPDDGDGCI
jgi:predicted lipoprotein with Yx(FWY)xxD motif